ncbi:MAG: prepilin-type N-terminal cleavage/methylation domain-containing protein [Saccharofermentanales bacterium]
MKNKKNQGMTLLEIIIAIAILGLLAGVFLSSFSTGYINIFNMGIKTKAMYRAQTILDQVNDSRTPTSTFIQSLEPDAVEFEDLGDVSPASRIWFDIDDKVTGGQTFKVVTVLIYYNNSNYTVLSMLMP